jgi:hypothetical protein
MVCVACACGNEATMWLLKLGRLRNTNISPGGIEIMIGNGPRAFALVKLLDSTEG